MQIEAASEVAQDVTKELTRFQRYTGNLIDNALNAGTKVLIVIVLFFIGRFLINIIRKLLRKSLERSSVNNGNIKFIDATVRILLYILLIGLLAGYFGIETASVVALLGSAGLTVGLAFQGSLSNFAGGTVSGTIDGIPYEYSLSNVSPEDGNYYAILAETETAETRLAWQALTEQINSATQAEDSYVLIKNGSTIQIGTEQLSFETGDDLLLDNLNDLSSLQDAVRSHLQLTTGAAAAEGQIVIVLKAGTQLAVGGSVATLKKDATIVVNGMSDTANLDTLLSSLRNTDDVATMVKKLVYSIGDITNSVNSGGITVNVSFSEES